MLILSMPYYKNIRTDVFLNLLRLRAGNWFEKQ